MKVEQLQFQDYMANLTQTIKSLNYQILNMDEIENFRDYYHPLFDFPFSSRNIVVNSFDLYDTFKSYSSKTQDYQYLQTFINYQISQVCLESPWYEDLDIFSNFQTEYDGYNKQMNPQDQTDDFECDSGNLF